VIGSCPRCGEKVKGFFKACGRCEQTLTLQTESKAPKKVMKEAEDDE
jgi:hypothetical protein